MFEASKKGTRYRGLVGGIRIWSVCLVEGFQWLLENMG